MAQTPAEIAKADSIVKAKADSILKSSIDNAANEVLKKQLLDSLAIVKGVCDSCDKIACDTSSVKIHKPGALVEPFGSWTLVFLPLVLLGLIIWLLFSKLGKFNLQEALTENEYVKKTIKNPEYTAVAATTLAGTNASANVNTILPPTIDITDISNNAFPTTFGILDAQIKDKKVKLASQIIDDKAANDKEQLAIDALLATNAEKPIRQAALSTKLASDKAKYDQTQVEIDQLITKSSELPATPRASSSRFIALVTSMLTLIMAVCLCSFFIYFYIATGTAPDISKFSSVLLALGIGVVPYAFNKVATAITNRPTNNE